MSVKRVVLAVGLVVLAIVGTGLAAVGLGFGGRSPEEEAAAIDAAVLDLLAIRQAPIDLGHFEGAMSRPVGLDDVVTQGPYLDGPPMAFAGPADQLSREEIRDALASAVAATPTGAEKVEDALALFDQLGEDESADADRVPNPNLQATAAYLSVIGTGVDLFAERELGVDPLAFVFPTAEPAVGLSPQESAEAAGSFRPFPIVGSSSATIYDGQRVDAVAFDPARRWEDPRLHMLAASWFGVDCSLLTEECSTLLSVVRNRRYLDFVLEDPKFALSRTASIRILNTRMMGFLNSAALGASAPQIAPDDPLGIFIDAAENSTAKQDLELTCNRRTGGPIDCWEYLYLESETFRGVSVAFSAAAGTTLITRTDTEVELTGLPLNELLFADGVGEIPTTLVAGDAPQFDDVMPGIITPEENVAYRFIVGLLGFADLEAVAEVHDLDPLVLAEHISTTAGTDPLVELDAMVAGGSGPDPTTDPRSVGDDRLGEVAAVFNSTEVEREDGFEITVARFERVDVAPGDVIRNGDEGLAEIAHTTGELTRLDERTTISVADDPPPDRSLDFTLEVGSLWHRAAPPEDGADPVASEFGVGQTRVSTEDGVLAVVCDPDGVCQIVVLEGTVTVTLANGETIELGPLDLLIIGSDGIEVEQLTVLAAELRESEWIASNLAIDEENGLDEPAVFELGASVDFSGRYVGTRTRASVSNVDVADEEATVPVTVLVRRECAAAGFVCSYTVDSSLFAFGGAVTSDGFSSSTTFENSEEDGSCTWSSDLSLELTFGPPGPGGAPSSITGTEVFEATVVADTPGDNINCLSGVATYDWELTPQ
ncbi:MAG: hypothetical protein AAF547_01590 [Actinomycetota bacterium]